MGNEYQWKVESEGADTPQRPWTDVIDPSRKGYVPEEPSSKRQDELERDYEQRKGSTAPYKGVSIGSIDEMYWIMRRHNWSGAYVLPKGMVRANFSGAVMRGLVLKDMYLHGANLNGISFFDSDISGSHLEDADLRGADLRRCQMDESTYLDRILIDSHTRLGDIRWNGTPLLDIDWRQITRGREMRLGDEDPDVITGPSGDGTAQLHKTSHQATLRRVGDAIRAYQGLGYTFSSQNMGNEASRCRLREQRLQRRILLLTRRPSAFLAGLGSWLLDLVSGYGELPFRIFGAYTVTIVMFALLNFILTNTLTVSQSVAHLSWDEALILSLTSFHGRGFFPGYLNLNDWIARISAVEAVMGLFIEIVFIATFSRRFLRD